MSLKSRRDATKLAASGFSADGDCGESNDVKKPALTRSTPFKDKKTWFTDLKLGDRVNTLE